MTIQADLVIREGRIVTANGVVEGDIAIAQEKIVAIGDIDASGVCEISADGDWVMPGGVDPHAHIEQMSGMGLMNADTFETATRSAAFGGTTSVISFAAQQKGERLTHTVAEYHKRAVRGAMIDHAFHVTVSDTAAPNFESDLEAVILAGHRSLKVFTTYDIQLADKEILQIMTKAREHGALVCVHAENDAIISQARETLIHSGHVSPSDHALSRPRMAEIEAVERMCRFAEYQNQPVMLFHISTKEGAAAVRAARARGVPVWAETCQHYLMMTDDVLKRPHGAKWMCSPPQRKADDQTALWAALSRGDLQLVSSDHAPYRYDETGKLSAGVNAPFHKIANGLPGLETRLPLLFDALVSGTKPDPVLFAELTSSAAARLYGLSQKGQIAEGKDADLVIWDSTKQTTYADDDLHDNVGYNPWEGRTIRGWPRTVLLRGSVIVDQGGIKAEPGFGNWLDRPALSAEMEEKVAK